MKSRLLLKRCLCPVLFAALFFTCLPFSLAAAAQAEHPDDENKTINYIINTDESTVIDRLLHHALGRIGYNMTMDAAPMSYAIQMANSGERDALANQSLGTELIYPNLVRIPEKLSETGFQVFDRYGSERVFTAWEDLSGLTVGHLFQKTYIISHLPDDIAGSVQRETFYDLNLALLAGECDVIVTTSTFDLPLDTAPGVRYAGTVDIGDSYTFVNKKFEHIVPAFSESIAAMKADGIYDKIVSGEWQQPGHVMSILHISSFFPENIWEAGIKAGITEALGANDDISYFNIPLFSNRFHSEYEQARNAYFSLRTLMMSNPPDVVIATDKSAILFVCNYYYTLFQDIPVILYGVGTETDRLWQLGGNYTALWDTTSAAQSARMIKDIFPQTDTLFVINDYTVSGLAWREDIEQYLGSSFEGMDVLYNDNVSFDMLLSELKALPGTAAVLLGYYASDAAGVYFTGTQFDSAIVSAVSNPVFGMQYGCIGSGQAGGFYIDPLPQGNAIGRLALDIIADIRAGRDVNLPGPFYSTQTHNRVIFDEQVIKALQINKNRLPANAEFINRKLSLYETNPQAFIMMLVSGMLALLIISGLSAFTYVMRRKNRDLSEIQKNLHTAEELKQAADAANKAKSAFLANISHEIRTPMNSIVGFSELALDYELPEKVKWYIEKIQESSAMLLSVISDILNISKIESGKVQLEYIPFNLSGILDSCRDTIKPLADSKGVMLTWDSGSCTGKTLFGDPVKLRQAMLNLLSNAVKFTAEGSVKCRAFTEDVCDADGVCGVKFLFEVKDTGIGMDSGNLQTIFEPFMQADSSITRKYGGTGLGLAITKNIIELMGGTLTVESEPGIGSKFTFEVTFEDG